MQPYHFDYWMLAMARWQPKKAKNFPSYITFWVRVLGVPLEFLAAPTFESIGDAIVETSEVDLDYGRLKMVVDGFKELSFDTTMDFTGGEYHDVEEALVTLSHANYKGDEGGARYRNSHWEASKIYSQEDRPRYSRDSRRTRSPHSDDCEEPHEEGGIQKENKEVKGNQNKDKEIPHVISRSNRDENGENGGDVDDFPNLIDGELEDTEKLQDRCDEIAVESKVSENEEGSGLVIGERENKMGAHKKLFMSDAGGATKKRLVQALISPRKRPTTKQVNCQGGGAKQTDEKGPSNPNLFQNLSKFFFFMNCIFIEEKMWMKWWDCRSRTFLRLKEISSYFDLPSSELGI
ncbi:hypothetical protein N665_0007s0018 [Sinapis alba]|nr:hypothetical protein N665_0007s0018 [Sinapis alba]